MTERLCPWSGRKCGDDCPRTFPWKWNGIIPWCCNAWRAFVRYAAFKD